MFPVHFLNGGQFGTSDSLCSPVLSGCWTKPDGNVCAQKRLNDWRLTLIMFRISTAPPQLIAPCLFFPLYTFFNISISIHPYFLICRHIFKSWIMVCHIVPSSPAVPLLCSLLYKQHSLEKKKENLHHVQWNDLYISHLSQFQWHISGFLAAFLFFRLF